MVYAFGLFGCRFLRQRHFLRRPGAECWGFDWNTIGASIITNAILVVFL